MNTGTNNRNIIMGIDIGGTGIKGAPVDIDTGLLVAERYRILTPQPATPQAVVKTVKRVVRHFDWEGPVGIGFPAIIKRGVVYSAAHVDDSWIGVDGTTLFAEASGCPVTLLNDADAAGLAEVRFGVGRDEPGVIILITLGTGIGSAIFNDGVLLPNTELGHLEFRGGDAEDYASERIREEEKLSWKKLGRRVNNVLHYYEFIFSPDLFILGGGGSKKFNRYAKQIDTDTRVVAAELRNEAGIVGAAVAAHNTT